MTLSGFHACPRIGHLKCAKRVVAYLAVMKHGMNRSRINEPDFSDIELFEYDCWENIYPPVLEGLPHDAPEPLGRFVTLLQYVDVRVPAFFLDNLSQEFYTSSTKLPSIGPLLRSKLQSKW